MNQLDLWSGGQQSNRATKYLNMKFKNDSVKLLCVIANPIVIHNINKIYQLFDLGFRNDTLCYPNGIERIIINFLI